MLYDYARAYYRDLDLACDEVDWLLERYGYVLWCEIDDIAWDYDVDPYDILDEFGWLK